MDMEATEESN